MTDERMLNGPAGVQSPCVGVCWLDNEGAVCVGCGRTLEEIRGWRTMSDEEKHAVWMRLGGHSGL